jgi:hypothetical protein
MEASVRRSGIKHNDLTHYFLRPHEELPRAYLASCEKFFKELSNKQQEAPSAKLQAPSTPAGLNDATIKK